MNKKSNFIDFFDTSQVYLDFLSSCSVGLHYLASVSDVKDLSAIAATVDFAVQRLKQLFDDYSESLQGGDKHGK